MHGETCVRSTHTDEHTHHKHNISAYIYKRNRLDSSSHRRLKILSHTRFHQSHIPRIRIPPLPHSPPSIICVHTMRTCCKVRSRTLSADDAVCCVPECVCMEGWVIARDRRGRRRASKWSTVQAQQHLLSHNFRHIVSNDTCVICQPPRALLSCAEREVRWQHAQNGEKNALLTRVEGGGRGVPRHICHS